MKKLNPHFKICLKKNKNINTNLNIFKLKKKKWNFLKKNLKNLNNSIEIKPEERKKFYKERLFSKQQLKFFYGCLSEYKLKNIFKNIKLKKNKINVLETFIILIESRLDIVLFRLQITKSIFQAQQLIKHGKLKINNNLVYSSNYLLKNGDIISFDQNDILNFKNLNNKINYIEVNKFLKTIIFLRKPFFKEIEYPFFFNLNLIDEYFKKN